MRMESASAGEVRTTADTVEQMVATVSAPMRAVLLLGKGIPPGTYVSAGTRVDGGGLRPVGRCDARRNRAAVPVGRLGGAPELPVSFYARQSPAWSGQLSRFQPCTTPGRYMNQAAWVEIRLG
ncbi:hypothetical protein GCM10017771_38280 [Streptomyces capitiformicae]|uniref:Uncharacterized protein n=1 Tax=Streptomyces capitiformicae TaxID=2014920 RepID=A0A919LDS5_9ACTN|nr:hypothetical protein GCM10017771_38280 [Streptomyces capitiformicae]